jgi:hypothetical protein
VGGACGAAVEGGGDDDADASFMLKEWSRGEVKFRSKMGLEVVSSLK